MHTDADHGAFFSDAQPSKFKIGLMHSAFAAYDIPVAHLTARGTYSNKAPGGVAYRCSFRVTEAMFFQERMVQAAADDLGMDQAEFRRMNFVARRRLPAPDPVRLPDRLWPVRQVPGGRPEGGRLRGLPAAAGRSQGARPAARPRHLHDDRAARRGQQPRVRHPRHQDVRLGRAQGPHDRQGHPADRRQGQGQGHETTWAQIVAHELGIPAEDVVVEEGDTDTAPFGMGTYASRSTPVAGAAVAMVSRKIRAKARKLAAHLLEVSEEDVEWELGRFYVRSAPDRGVTIQECAMAAYSNMPDGMEPGLENTAYYDPPNLTWPFAVYIVTVEVDPADRRLGRAQHGRGRRLRRADQPDDRRGPDHGRADRGVRHGEHAVHHLRRRGQLRRLELHGLPAADRLGDARLRAAQRGRHAVPAPPDRRQGHRRVRGGRRPGRVRERGDGRARPAPACATSTCRCCPTGSGRPSPTAAMSPARRRCGPTDGTSEPMDGWG